MFDAAQRTLSALILVWILMLSCVVSASCRPAPDDPPTVDYEQQVIDALWRMHEAAIVHVLSEELGPLGPFPEAIDFFEETTGILSNTASYVGRVPTPDLPHALEKWRRWYTQHRDELQLDRESCALRVRTEDDSVDR